MVTIKSHTDLSQSMILSKILPLESADMFYVAGKGEPIFIGNKMVACGNDDYDALGVPDVLCWSLAALFGALPDRICCDNEKYYLNYKKDKVEYLGPLTWDGQKCITSKANTLVDACVEMIIKLHEQKLL